MQRAVRKAVRALSWGYRELTGRLYPGTRQRFLAARQTELEDLRAFFQRAGRELPEDLKPLERRWDQYTQSAFDPRHSQSFYEGWVGEVGYLNVVANTCDQFRRIELFLAYERWMPLQAGSLIDLGCGTAGLTLQFARRFDDVMLVDVDNVAKEFVRFKLERHRENVHARPVLPAALQEGTRADAFICVDVLEHLPNPSAVFAEQIDRCLQPGGLLFLQAPWAGGVPEHLAEAPVDWIQRGGEQLLARAYDKVAPISHLIERKPHCVSGVYRKRAPRP